MKPGDVIAFHSYNDDCRRPAGWVYPKESTYATVIEVHGANAGGYWAFDIMWPDGTVDTCELHELEFEVIK